MTEKKIKIKRRKDKDLIKGRVKVKGLKEKKKLKLKKPTGEANNSSASVTCENPISEGVKTDEDHSPAKKVKIEAGLVNKAVKKIKVKCKEKMKMKAAKELTEVMEQDNSKC